MLSYCVRMTEKIVTIIDKPDVKNILEHGPPMVRIFLNILLLADCFEPLETFELDQDKVV